MAVIQGIAVGIDAVWGAAGLSGNSAGGLRFRRLRCLDDNEVLARVASALSADRLREVDAHLDGCPSCLELVAAALLAADGATPTPAGAMQLGRYSVLGPVGAGAMGIVYQAYDPQLDRRVALKLLHAGAGDAQELRARLLQEAQAMARLSHPNVIAVHDVGTVREQVFVAMEFVEGRTLTRWLEQERGWREVLRVFILAGAGLSAAHEAGIVHRDFKPDNVLIGDNGQVRVTDFGLARLASPARALPGEIPVTAVTAPAGSPAYMAPEQLQGAAVDRRADLFSFCVALYEALYRERPFAGDDLGALSAEIAAGRVRDPPAGSRVPRWLRRTLLKGLSSRPEDRYPSMEALLRALARDPARARVRALAALMVLAAAGVAALWWQKRLAATAQPCSGAAARLSSAWDDGRRRAAHDAFAHSGVAWADAAWRATEKQLDAYAAAWTAMRTEACESSVVRREQSPELMDLRMACLDDRLRDLSAKVELLTRADAEVVQKAPGPFPDLGGCADVRALREGVQPPRDAQARERVAALRDRMARASALTHAGKYAEAIVAAQAIAAEAPASGYRPVIAEAGFLLGNLQALQDRDAEAEKTLRTAAANAEAGRDDALAARIWDQLAHVLATARLADAGDAAAMADAALERSGDAPLARASLERTYSWILRRQGRPADALTHSQAGLALIEKAAPGDPIEMALALSSVANNLISLGRYLEAQAQFERILALDMRAYGPRHPDVAEDENRLGMAFLLAGKRPEARTHCAEAVRIADLTLGTGHPLGALYASDLAWVCVGQRDFSCSRPLLQRALQISERTSGPESRETSKVLDSMGRQEKFLGNFRAAQRIYERALAIVLKLDGPESGEVARMHLNEAILLTDARKLAEARRHLDLAFAVWMRQYGLHHPRVALALRDLGRVALLERRYAEAAALFQRALDSNQDDADARATALTGLGRAQLDLGPIAPALATLEQAAALRTDHEPDELAATRFALAQALWQQRMDRPRAKALALQARDGYREEGPHSAWDLREVEAWLAGHSATAAQ